MTTSQHVVWDWNGTLLDDLPVVLDAVNATLGLLDGSPITADEYRDHYTRPVKAFYEGLFSRSLTEAEWHLLNDSYHEVYYSNVHLAPLTADALSALDVVDGLGLGQSLLSMTSQSKLEEIVGSHGLIERLDPVTGLPAQTGGHKTEHLVRHLDMQGLAGENVVVVGDTPDDVVAAQAVGAPAILYDGGSHHRAELEAVGVPIANSLIEAVEMAFGSVDGQR